MKKILNREFAKSGSTLMAKNKPVYRTTLKRTRPKIKSGKSPGLSPRINRSIRKSPKAGNRAKSKSSQWGIQVGAFYSHRPAEKLARQVSRKYASMLKDGQIIVMPLRKSRRRILYRARIIGIGKSTAYKACRMLKRNKKPCLELRLPGNIEVASR